MISRRKTTTTPSHHRRILSAGRDSAAAAAAVVVHHRDVSSPRARASDNPEAAELRAILLAEATTDDDVDGDDVDEWDSDVCLDGILE